MRQLIKFLALILILVKFSNAIRLTLTTYTNADFSGQSITFAKTQNNITQCTSELLGNITSVCYSGYWLYSRPQLTQNWLFGPEATINCRTVVNNKVSAVLRLGPEDTSIPAIVFKSHPATSTNFNYKIIEKLAEANINVVVNRSDSVIITYGRSRWTLFEGTNFEGKFECLDTSIELRVVDPLTETKLTTVGSVIRGCNFSREYVNQVRKSIQPNDTNLS